MQRRNTPTKKAVLAVLNSAAKAMSQDEIEQQINIEADRTTIYRILNRFCEDGILHRVVAEDGKQYFSSCLKNDEKKIPHHHFHFRCTSCETIECLPSAVPFSIPSGYNVEQVNCILTGTCEKCS